MRGIVQGGTRRAARMSDPAMLWAFFLGAPIALFGCRATSKAGQPTHVYLDPAFAGREIRSVVFVGTHSSAVDDVAPMMSWDYLRSGLRSQQERIFVTLPSDGLELARRAGKGELFEGVRDTWSGHHKVDPSQARQLCSTLRVDGLLFSSILRWQRVEADWKSGERSYTRVEMGLHLVDGSTGRLVWEARKDLLREAGGRAIDAENLGRQAVESAASPRVQATAPSPPTYEEVVEEVVRVLVAGLANLGG